MCHFKIYQFDFLEILGCIKIIGFDDSAYSGTVFSCFRNIESLHDIIEKEKRKIGSGQYTIIKEKVHRETF